MTGRPVHPELLLRPIRRRRPASSSDRREIIDGPRLVSLHPHSLYPQTWHFRQPSSYESWPAPQSGHEPRNNSSVCAGEKLPSDRA